MRRARARGEGRDGEEPRDIACDRRTYKGKRGPSRAKRQLLVGQDRFLVNRSGLRRDGMLPIGAAKGHEKRRLKGDRDGLVPKDNICHVPAIPREFNSVSIAVADATGEKHANTRSRIAGIRESRSSSRGLPMHPSETRPRNRVTAGMNDSPVNATRDTTN